MICSDQSPIQRERESVCVCVFRMTKEIRSDVVKERRERDRREKEEEKLRR